MTAAHDTQALAACPFCGHTAAAKLIDSRDFQDMVDGEFDESNEVYFAVVCDASKPAGPGGCGGMGGFAPTQETAIVLWNARPALASRLQEQEGQPALSGYAAAFYELAALMGLPAQAASPETVWREQMLPTLRATIAAGSQAVHVPGWKWVPVEPTKEMVDAGYMHTLRADEGEDDYYRARGSAIAAYGDMLDAAPLQPLAGGEVGNG